ncbi:MAG: glycosyltransferase family 2 protein [Rhodopila sp.]|jgi:GT2 family glycosyltransferase
MVVILNFNGIEDTLACLSTLCTQTCQDIVVQVIDNGSTADDLGRIATRFPEVELISLPENLGWAGGNNIGIRQALERGFGHVCLLNSDTLLDPTAIEELLVASALLEWLCLLHPAIAYYDEPAKWQLNPQLPPCSDAASQDLESKGDLVEMNWAYGACLLIPASVLARVGLLDERFFLQLEETDYFLRAKALNIRSFCARRARILHKESASFGGAITDAKTYYQVRNRFLLTEKHTPSFRGFLRAARPLIWALRNQAQARGIKNKGWPGFLRWLFSTDPIASAAREGARDYCCRRFGRRASTESPIVSK